MYWISDDMVGVTSTRAMVKGYKAEVGGTVPIKWKKEKIPHDAEILKLSGMANS